ncbi:uncharacterized protein LOC113008274 isoform X1 [Astatotilapia calliptera]|uniref:uncharacterized protein LOC113008274 isoform X1 n=1 Tax=Astatotilapia calliptera TaxID=8154 RepID=UPI000E3FED72|nr:uncharacterized protein LOC113008274 isoform X1 [Astatotilapia calliptera]
MPSPTPTSQQFISSSTFQSQRNSNTNLNMTTPHSNTSVETWKSLSDHFFGTIVPQWQSLQFNPEYCNTELPSTLLKDMLKLCSMLEDAMDTTVEKGDPVSTQNNELSLHSVQTESPEQTEETGAKDSILKEISVDDHCDKEETETPGLEDSSDSKNLKLHLTAEESSLDETSTDDSENREILTLHRVPAPPCVYPDILIGFSCESSEEEASVSSQMFPPQTLTAATVEPKKSCLKENYSKDLDNIEAFPLEKPVKNAIHVSVGNGDSDIGSYDVTLASDYLSEEKICVYKVIQLVVSEAAGKASSKYKDFTRCHNSDSISDRLLEKIWPQIDERDLDLSPKTLTNINKDIFTNLCKAHNCKEKYLILCLREQLDDITVPTFTKHLLALPKRVLTIYKNREEYVKVVESFTKDLVLHAISNANEARKLPPGADKAIMNRFTHRIWAKILSQKLKMSLENTEEVSVKVYNELRQKWKNPNTVLELMFNGQDNIENVIVKSFKRNAPLKRPNFFSRVFSRTR